MLLSRCWIISSSIRSLKIWSSLIFLKIYPKKTDWWLLYKTVCFVHVKKNQWVFSISLVRGGLIQHVKIQKVYHTLSSSGSTPLPFPQWSQLKIASLVKILALASSLTAGGLGECCKSPPIGFSILKAIKKLFGRYIDQLREKKLIETRNKYNQTLRYQNVLKNATEKKIH